ncbi:DUF2537 domain-containing protein [Nocardia blacklockiae]|uniref:DUF2537 domain-containing protein n=1 Tax=Nocardia blacklockiae TaxID=480036 RepID=UPI001893715F|nr:DUF2537 domain-containing protein [Nocardia blacklockiae]MBF6171632.1 DUF2537 domain-containing protein [Nocardia blacklockiae]
MTQPYGTPDDAEPTPWAPGLAVATLVALLTAAGVYSFGNALAHVHWLLSVAVNLIAVGGAAPTAWRWRATPVTRWVLGGLAAGVLLGWFVLLVAAVSA